VVALRASRLFDGWSPSMVQRPTVLVEDGRITAVEPGDVGPSPDREVLDLGDVTLLPGLIDAHVHLCLDAGEQPVAHLAAAGDDALLSLMRANAATALAAGITTVRDLGDRAFLAVALREELATGAGTAPEIVAAGPPLASPGGHCHFLGGEVTGVDGIRCAVRGAVERGADLIKIMGTGGVLTPHTDTLAPQFTLAEVTVDDGVRIDTALVDRMAASGTWVCPTWGVRLDRQGRTGPPPAVATRLARFPEVLAALHAARVRLVAGSDSAASTMRAEPAGVREPGQADASTGGEPSASRQRGSRRTASMRRSSSRCRALSRPSTASPSGVRSTRTARASSGCAARSTSPCACTRSTSSTTLWWRSCRRSASSRTVAQSRSGKPLRASRRTYCCGASP
jgi:hypothetical protein